MAQVNDYGDAVGIISRAELTHDNLKHVRERFEGPRKPRFKDLFRSQADSRRHGRAPSVHSANSSLPYGTAAAAEAIELFPNNRAFTAVEVPLRVGEFDASADGIAQPGIVHADSDTARRQVSLRRMSSK